MPVTLTCPRCSRRSKASDAVQHGQRFRCPSCQEIIIATAPPVVLAEQDSPPTVVYTPPPPLPAVGFRCPFCQTTQRPITVTRISRGGWIMFVVLLFVCLPVCWLGLCILESFHKCSQCGMKLD